jgi:hypothetical protein
MVAVVALAIAGAPASASAAPKPAKPTSIQVEGKDLADTLIVSQADSSRLFENLLSEVSWMASAKPQTTAPAAGRLGPKYTLTVLAKTVPLQVYDLYPMAAGGPRAHRPANQPAGKKADGWFYGRLTMSETLRVSGVPLKAKPDVVNGGIGGGVGQDLDAQDLSPVESMADFLTEMRHLMLLNGAVLIVIVFGLAGIAFLIRRRV